MRVVALLATYNEERFIDACVENLVAQGVDVYVIDNESTDRTLELAKERVGRGIVGIESFPRDGVYRWRAILERKEQLADELDADWFMHLDCDEMRLPPRPGTTLAEAFSELDAMGYNAVNFNEFTFIPTQEAPDHDHRRFQETMRWYYPYKTDIHHGLKAWQKPPRRSSTRGLPFVSGRPNTARLAWSGGHRIRFRGLRPYPHPFRMRHYLFLSIPHAIEKYVERRYDAAEVSRGWHQWRARVTAGALQLPSSSELRPYESDELLDPSNPRREHYVAAWV
jgi:glycosyltransferase involved in cell wall biosynthesis